MKKFEEPEVEIVRLGLNDVIVTSGEGCASSTCPNEAEEDEVG